MLVYLHGNCQARAIAEMLREQFPDWKLCYYEVFADKIIEEIDRYRSIVASADIIIAQPISAGYRDRDDLSLEWVRANARPSAKVIVFPSLYFSGPLIGWTSLAVPAYGMDYHDALLLQLSYAENSPENIVQILLSDQLYDDNFIESEIKRSLQDLEMREIHEHVDIAFSPFLESRAFEEQLFHVVNHPGRPALAYVANEALHLLGLAGTVSAIGPDYLPFPHVPCSPAVRRYFRSRGRGRIGSASEEPDLYHLPSERLIPAEYILKQVAHLRSLDDGIIKGCVQDHRVSQFIERVISSGTVSVDVLGPPRTDKHASEVTIEPLDLRALVMRFESLGGCGHGCEFGLFQREFGAEPLGLLRWADLGPEQLTAALKSRFEGVGEQEFTIVFVPEPDDWKEWWTRDTRYWMAMRSFVKTSDVTYEGMVSLIAKRQRFLKDKLLQDLSDGEKVFVYKNMYRNLDDEEIDALFGALNAYGKNILLYIAHEDDIHINGSVEVRQPGLLVGYIDHFSHSPTNEHIGPSTNSLLAICKRASELVTCGAVWRSSAPAEAPSLPAIHSVDHGLELADQARASGDNERALQIWASVRHREPGHSAAYLRAAFLLGELGLLDQADEMFAAGIANSPHDRSLWIGYAMRAHQSGSFDDALKRWEQANTQFPNQEDILPHYVSLLRHCGRSQEADDIENQKAALPEELCSVQPTKSVD